MAKIIVFGSQKGGVGKSTLTALTATALSAPPFSYRITVLDADPQNSLVDARSYDLKSKTIAPNYQIIATTAQTIQQQLQTLDATEDFIFVDLAGKLDVNLHLSEQEITPTLLNTDLLVIPFTAGNYGLDATLRYLHYVLDIVKIKQRAARPLQVLGFINMHVGRWKEDKFLREMVEDIASETGLRFMSNNLGFYATFRSANTLESLYFDAPKANQPELINFKKWLNELHKIIENV
jgi:cellulose biosynthesis protein BcsQ